MAPRSEVDKILKQQQESAKEALRKNAMRIENEKVLSIFIIFCF